MQHERYRQQSLDPFYPWSAVKKIDISAESKNKNSGVNFLIVILNKIKDSITYKLISPMSFKGVYSRQRCSERKQRDLHSTRYLVVIVNLKLAPSYPTLYEMHPLLSDGPNYPYWLAIYYA
jgi:hypothetical protein